MALPLVPVEASAEAQLPVVRPPEVPPLRARPLPQLVRLPTRALTSCRPKVGNHALRLVLTYNSSVLRNLYLSHPTSIQAGPHRRYG